MTEYHKINTIYKRDMTSKRKTLIEGDWTCEEFEYLANNPWVFTEKVDGTNIRVVMDGGKSSFFTFEGREENSLIPKPLQAALVALFHPLTERMREDFPTGGVLYGEGYGPRIQKGGGNYRTDVSFVMFDVHVGGYWLRRHTVEEIGTAYGIDVVPVIGRGTLHDAVKWAKEGIRSQWGDFEAEGIVARPAVELFNRGGKRIITKIKCRDFRT